MLVNFYSSLLNLYIGKFKIELKKNRLLSKKENNLKDEKDLLKQNNVKWLNQNKSEIIFKLKETKNIKVIWPNNKETFVSDGDDWFSSAEKAGLEIPTGCLTGSCGACEIDVNGKTVRACISDIKNNKKNILKVSLTTDPFWEN